VASWLVAAGSERQVLAVVCGSGVGGVLIELWSLFVWLDIPFVSSVVSAGFPFVVKWMPFHRCGEGVLCLGKLSAGYVAMCCVFPGWSIGFCRGNFF
jgi:hypothetical protein